MPLSTINAREEMMHNQRFSSFCGLCAMNNAIGISRTIPPIFDVFDLNLAADIMWLKQVCEVGFGLSVPLEPMCYLISSNLAFGEAALTLDTPMAD